MSAGAGELGAFERVLSLKAVPELSDVHPDDLATVAERTTAHRLAAGDLLPGEGEGGCMHFLLEGSVREACGHGAAVEREAPALLGALRVLAGNQTAAAVAECEATTLSIGRSALIEVLREDFEVWFALLRHVCRLALEARGSAFLARETLPDGARAPARPAELGLAERILLLRRVPALGELRIHVLGQVAAEMDDAAFRPGEVVLEPGLAVDSLYVVVAGSVTQGSEGPEVGPGSLLGFAEAFAGQERRHAVTACTPLCALELAPETLVDLLEDHPDAAVDLLCALAREALRLAGDGAGTHERG